MTTNDKMLTLKTPGVSPLPNSSWVGLVLVLNGKGKTLAEQHKKPANQLWRANGGFGCEPAAIGRAVFATCLNDGEGARWDRVEFIGVASDELVKQVCPHYVPPVK